MQFMSSLKAGTPDGTALDGVRHLPLIGEAQNERHNTDNTEAHQAQQRLVCVGFAGTDAGHDICAARLHQRPNPRKRKDKHGAPLTYC